MHWLKEMKGNRCLIEFEKEVEEICLGTRAAVPEHELAQDYLT